MTRQPGSDNGTEVYGVSELAQRIVAAAHRRYPVLRTVAVVALSVLAVVCLAATLTRLSLLPLLPLPLLGLGFFAVHKARAADNDRSLLLWSTVLVSATAVAFWLIGVIARGFD
ncbi:hypothetical protein SAMN05216266_107117 [Amycolatopsis marina]|uniref:MYXO-CTERM domain-containing protein n=1 Tax=Amycolatopsis marina TaxID=490629 RepID=A0A1I0ZQU0_9PSEU|nr:hypothetical protein [Amycolatopsis marina]SFB26728.1 hypothetical protein SAMN05216266_107117 [Amycolatopsis marina]